MGKKGNSTKQKKKLTKKEKKQANHLRLVEGKKGSFDQGDKDYHGEQKKKAA